MIKKVEEVEIDNQKVIKKSLKNSEKKAESSINKVQDLMSILDDMTSNDLLELNSRLKEKYNLEGLNLSSGSQENNNQESIATSEVSLILEDLGSATSIQALKVFNKILGLSVSQAKEAVNNLPFYIMKDVGVKEAEEMKAKLDEAQPGLVLSIN